MISAMVQARENTGASSTDITNLKNSLMAKSYEDIETLYQVVHPLVSTPKQETTSNPYFTTATYDQQVSAKENITNILEGSA